MAVLQRFKWVLAAIVLVLGGVLWGLQPSQMERHQHILHSRFQEIQNLQVLEAHFLAHETLRDEHFLNTNEFLIVARGKGLYGLDLSQAQITHESGKVQVILPPVELQDMVLSPQDIEFLGVKKGWLTRQSQFEQYQRKALIQLEADLKKQAEDPRLYCPCRKTGEANCKTNADGSRTH